MPATESRTATSEASALTHLYGKQSILSQVYDKYRQVEARFRSDRFELVHVSEVEGGLLRGVRRYLYHLRDQ